MDQAIAVSKAAFRTEKEDITFLSAFQCPITSHSIRTRQENRVVLGLEGLLCNMLHARDAQNIMVSKP